MGHDANRNVSIDGGATWTAGVNGGMGAQNPVQKFNAGDTLRISAG